MAVLCAGVAWLYALGAAEAEKAVKPALEAPVLDERHDPLEGLNRITSAFDRRLRELIIDPIVDGNQAITPDEVQESNSNVGSNLTEPPTAVGSLEQGDFDAAETAADLGMEQRREDIDQAQGAADVPPGPHIVLPVLGPGNLRGAPGDTLSDLLGPIPLDDQAGAGAVEYADNQEAIKELGNSVVDPYVAERDADQQHRDYLVHNGRKVPLPTIAEIE